MIASIRDISQKGDPGGPWGFLMNDFMDGMVLEETHT
jgi:hypothetical protein